MTNGLGLRAGVLLAFAVILSVLVAMPGRSAPFASFVIDARTGEVLHAENADTRLHPASLTKMMTLYIAFQAVENGEITLDTMITVSRHAAAEPPSKLGLRPGQKIALRHLIRAAAVKSANDAATAIGEAIGGSEAAFARRMTRTAQALGMTRTTFRNAHGLTEDGHLSTARDMTTLGRHLFYDYPQYYNLFSRRTADARVAQVSNTNRRFLDAYEGADGIKTGYTSAAGFNLVASAQRGQERIIATVFGGKSTAWRNAKMADLLDLGFRKAPSRATVQKPARPAYAPDAVVVAQARDSGAVARSLRPRARPAAPAVPDAVLVALNEGIESVLAEVQGGAPAAAAVATAPLPVASAGGVVIALADAAAPRPEPRPEGAPAETLLAAVAPQPAPEVIRSTAAAGDGPVLLQQTEPQAETLAMAGTIEWLAAPRDGAEDLPGAAAAAPPSRPALVLAAVAPASVAAPVEPEVVTRLSTSGERYFGINLGRKPTRDSAERLLLATALSDIDMLSDALRKVVQRGGGFEANFVGMTEQGAALACQRLAARGQDCTVIAP